MGLDIESPTMIRLKDRCTKVRPSIPGISSSFRHPKNREFDVKLQLERCPSNFWWLSVARSSTVVVQEVQRFLGKCSQMENKITKFDFAAKRPGHRVLIHVKSPAWRDSLDLLKECRVGG